MFRKSPQPASGRMRRDWDAIAKFNAYYGICSLEEFEDPQRVDMGKFWQSGEDLVEMFLPGVPLADYSSKDMVEIGCGIGRMTQAFARRFRHVWGFDVSPEMLKRAREFWGGLSNVDFVLGNGQDLRPLDDASVDFVFSLAVLQHIPDPETVLSYLREIGRALRDGGAAFLQFRTTLAPSGEKGSSMRARLRQFRTSAKAGLLIALRRLGLRKWRRGEPLWADLDARYESFHGCAVPIKEAEAVFREAGLRVHSVEGIGTQNTIFVLTRNKRG